MLPGPAWSPPRVLIRHRRAVAAALLLLAALSLVATWRPRSTAPTPVVVARRDLPAGTELSAGDLTLRSVPDDVVPDGALTSVADAVGAAVTSGVRRGEVLTDLRAQAGYRDILAPGEVAAPVRVADGGVAAVLRVGQVVDLVATGTNTAARVLVSSARVIALPDAASTDPLSGALIVLAVPSELATSVVGANAQASLSVVLH